MSNDDTLRNTDTNTNTLEDSEQTEVNEKFNPHKYDKFLSKRLDLDKFKRPIYLNVDENNINIGKEYIKNLAKQQYTYLTAKRKWTEKNKELKTNLILNINSFKKSDQMRVPDFEFLKRYYIYLKLNITNLKRKALLFAYYTGLRTFELLKITWSHIDLLKKKVHEIDLIRKYGSKWYPVYFTNFVNFLNLYFSEPPLNLNDKVFPFSRNTLLNEAKNVYTLANGRLPPKGFGIHTNRYYLATMLAKENIGISKELLGHSKTQTTIQYIKNEKNEELINKIIENDPFLSSL